MLEKEYKKQTNNIMYPLPDKLPTFPVVLLKYSVVPEYSKMEIRETYDPAAAFKQFYNASVYTQRSSGESALYKRYAKQKHVLLVDLSPNTNFQGGVVVFVKHPRHTFTFFLDSKYISYFLQEVRKATSAYRLETTKQQLARYLVHESMHELQVYDHVILRETLEETLYKKK